MRARLARARRRRASRRARSTRRRSRSCGASRGERPGRILSTKALLAAPDRRTRCRAPYRSGRPATSRPRSSGRRTGGSTPQTYRDGLGGHEPPIPADLMARVFREYERRKDEPRARSTSRTCSSSRCGCSRRTSTRCARAARALPRVHRRRVPGREPAAADAARALARRRATTSAPSATTTSRSTASPARRPSGCSALPRRGSRRRRSSGSRRTTARRRRCSRSRTGSCRSSAAPRRRCAPTRPDGPEPVARPFDVARGRGRVRRRARPRAAREGVPLRGDGGARAARTRARPTSRRCSHEAGIPFQGASLLARDAARRLLKALRGAGSAAGRARCGGSRVEQGWLDAAAGQARRARADAPDRPRAARAARRGVRRRHATVGVRRELRGALRRDGARRAASTCSRYHRAKGLEFEAVFLPRLEEKELPSKPARTTPADRRGAAPALRRHDAREAAPAR